jgi:glutamate synthase (NADPH/NADH) small chain
LVLLALGFTGAEPNTLANQTSTEFDNQGNVARSPKWQTAEDGFFVAGDAGRGQSLIVWAIAEGRSAAAAIDEYLEGVTQLPSPVKPSEKSFDL